MGSEKNRIIYLDILRIIACISVVVLHTASMQLWQADIQTNSWIKLIVFDGVSRFGVPIFVMISGALLLDKKEDTLTVSKSNGLFGEWRQEWVIIRKRIIRIVVAFIFWSAVYTVYSTVYHHLNIFGICKTFLKGPTHFWFLFMIAALYLIIPLLRLIANSKYVEYFLILGVIFNFVLPIIVWLCGIVDSRIQEIIEYPINNMSFSLTKGYAFYFILGHWLKNKEFSRKERSIIYILSAMGFVLVVGGTIILSRKDGTVNEYFFNNSSIGVGLEALGVFVLIKSLFSRRSFSKRTLSVLKLLSSSTFGIYLIHVLILHILDYFEINALTVNAVFMVPMTALITIALSFGCYYLISQIPWFNKYII